MNEVRAEIIAQSAYGLRDNIDNEHPYWKMWLGWKKGDPYPTQDDVPSDAWITGSERQARLAKLNRAAEALENKEDSPRNILDMLKDK